MGASKSKQATRPATASRIGGENLITVAVLKLIAFYSFLTAFFRGYAPYFSAF
jgi:hypothetical protein